MKCKRAVRRMTDAEVRRIIVGYHRDGLTQVRLAEDFGCSRWWVGKIVHGEAHRGVYESVRAELEVE